MSPSGNGLIDGQTNLLAFLKIERSKAFAKGRVNFNP